MRVFQNINYPGDIWFTDHKHWNSMMQWLSDHEIEFSQECWCNTGVGFRLLGSDKGMTLFLLRWV